MNIDMEQRRATMAFRWVCWLAAVSLVAAACGSDPVADTGTADEAQSSGTAATDGDAATTSTGEGSAAGDEAEDQEAEGEEVAELAGPWPAPALPVAATYEFDHRTQGMEGLGDHLFFFDIATMYRLDPETGTVDSFVLPQSDEHSVGPVYSVATETDLFLAASSTDWGFDLIAGIDPIAFERTSDYTVPLGEPWAIPQANAGSGVLVSVQPNVHLLDADMMTLSAPLAFATVTDALYRDGDRTWVWRLDGTGAIYDADGQEIAALDLGRAQARLMHRAIAVDDNSIWHGDNLTAILTQFDRSTGEKLREVDLSARYGDDAHVELTGWQETESGFIIAEVERDGEGWFVLIELDTTTGEVLSDHVFARSGADVFGTILFDDPEVEIVGDRAFVRDHRRRIVEVDRARLGQVDTAWEDSGLEQAPVLSPEDREVGDRMLEWADGLDVPTTDPALTESIEDTLVSSEPWEVLEVVIDGDRAWGSLVNGAQDATLPLVMRRIDGSWQIETRSLCLLSFNFGTNDCEL